jgi:hypothetical protein
LAGSPCRWIRFGHVVDFIDLRVWPVFNVADMAICTGAALVAYYFFVLHDEKQVFRSSGIQVFRSDNDGHAQTAEQAGE